MGLAGRGQPHTFFPLYAGGQILWQFCLIVSLPAGLKVCQRLPSQPCVCPPKGGLLLFQNCFTGCWQLYLRRAKPFWGLLRFFGEPPVERRVTPRTCGRRFLTGALCLAVGATQTDMEMVVMAP